MLSNQSHCLSILKNIFNKDQTTNNQKYLINNIMSKLKLHYFFDFNFKEQRIEKLYHQTFILIQDQNYNEGLINLNKMFLNQ